MIARASARYVRASPTKTRWVVGLISGRRVEEALHILKFTRKRPAKIISKLLDSAVANAQVNPNVAVDALFIRRIFVDQGPALKRFRARAMGRASRIRKPTSHITVVLDEKII